MKLKLYQISADPRELEKVTAATQYVEIPASKLMEPTAPIDILSPSFIINNDSSLYSYNYLYCDTFGRFYYIDSMSILPGGRILIQCSVDVLQTYKDDILSTIGTVTRSESIGAPTLYTDKQLPIHPVNKFVTSIEMPETSGSFSADGEYSYLLTLIGGTPEAGG